MTTLVDKLNQAIVNIPDYPQKGVIFKDITPIFAQPELYAEVIKEFAKEYRGKADVICGIESRGFLFGISIAQELGIPFILIRKKGKLPPPVISEKYELEYGFSEIEIKSDFPKNAKVILHDDVLATGGTAVAATRLIEKVGGKVVQYSFLINLTFLPGNERLKKECAGNIHSIIEL